MNPAISEYMRGLQRRSGAKRWSGLSPAERSAAMKALRAKGKLKPASNEQHEPQNKTAV
jgi:predicted Fe-S protein YdhL (DUF1289 family)